MLRVNYTVTVELYTVKCTGSGTAAISTNKDMSRIVCATLLLFSFLMNKFKPNGNRSKCLVMRRGHPHEDCKTPGCREQGN
jgi:hypothetical protein